MPEQEKKETRHARLYLLGGFLLIVLLVYVGVLYNTQVVHGAEYLEQSVRTITKQELVSASRGLITDRNGQALVSNRQTYNLTFDPSLLTDKDDKNACILRLIQLFRERNLSWTDGLPVTDTEPYSYTLDDGSIGPDDAQRNRFLKFLQSLKLVSADLTTDSLSAEMLSHAGLTADMLLSQMRTQLEIPADWSNADARAVLGVRYELAVRELINTSSYIMVEDVTSDLVALLNDGDYTGSTVSAASTREYQTSFAAHILGYVSQIYKEDYAQYKEKGYAMDALVGKSGVEAAFEDYLRGTSGKRVVSTNNEGKVTGEYYSVEPKPGDTVELTIDLPFQQSVEEALAATVSRMTASDGITRGAGAVAVQVGTGDILALASYPTYDPADYLKNYTALSKNPAKPFLNRATQGTYAPGSTFKPCTAVAALESGTITTSTTVRDRGIYTYYAPSYTPHCWIYPGNHGLVNVTKAITVSCNYFFFDVGRRTGIETLDQYAKAFGLGQPTGIEIGDASGVLAGPEYAESKGLTWSGGQTIAAAIGQSYHLFTPLQLANYIATLVSGGKHYPAHLLRSVKTYDNSQVVYTEDSDPESTVQISDTTLNAVKTGMHGLTSSGGSLSSYFRSCVVDAGAKTGTAQVTKNTKNNGVFVCFAPYENPQIALAIVIEKGGSGSALASTAVKILNAYFSEDEVGTVIITGENTLLS